MKQSFKTVQKSITVLILFMSLAQTSFSQTSKFSLSINSLSTTFNYGKSNSAMRPYKKDFRGLQIGASYQAGISPMFSVVPEFYFALKGGILKQGNALTENKSTLRFCTFEAPVLARMHIQKFYLNAGPYATYALGGRIKTAGSERVPATSTSISFGNSSGAFKRWDMGIQAGAGYNFTLKKSTLTLDVRYGYGLVNISSDIERYNRMLNISLLLSRNGKKGSTEKHG
ncbi:MAG: PorT family protein [Saprospiraceae bacterium]|nr:PorT family protein [Saprospiraceae bacterium]